MLWRKSPIWFSKTTVFCFFCLLQMSPNTNFSTVCLEVNWVIGGLFCGSKIRVKIMYTDKNRWKISVFRKDGSWLRKSMFFLLFFVYVLWRTFSRALCSAYRFVFGIMDRISLEQDLLRPHDIRTPFKHILWHRTIFRVMKSIEAWNSLFHDTASFLSLSLFNGITKKCKKNLTDTLCTQLLTFGPQKIAISPNQWHFWWPQFHENFSRGGQSISWGFVTSHIF